MTNRNYTPRSPSGNNNEARRFIDTHDLLHPARRPMPVQSTPFVPSKRAKIEEYNSSHSYSAGDFFIVTVDTTISGIAVAAGFYGVPTAGVQVINGVSTTWAGYVPASPTGNAVPQTPLPAIGAAPNDKFYARCIVRYCPP